ncbi:MAG: hypothetical protein HY303_05310 [Candidatus Wallbacteria bacterium]|nr:hypothetical protein [Candidatus Wallbacteria bacterium]
MSCGRQSKKPVTGESDRRTSDDAGLVRLLEMAMRNSVEKISAMLQVPILIDGAAVTPAAAGLIELPASTPCTAVLLGIRGETGGNLLMSLTNAGAVTLCEMAPDEFKQYMPEPAERLQALMEELGNLLASTYLDVFSDVAGMRLLPTPPRFLRLSTEALCESLLAPLAEGPASPGARLFTSHLVLRSPLTRMLIASVFPGDAVRRILEGARKCMPELF